MGDVSSTRLYLGNLPRTATKPDIEEHFSSHGTGKITEIKLMNGFGFIEYEDARDARDIVPAFHGSDFKGERLTVQFARGPRHKENFAGMQDRNAPPRPRRTQFRMQITGLPSETSWQREGHKGYAMYAGLSNFKHTDNYYQSAFCNVDDNCNCWLGLTFGQDLKDFARQAQVDVVYSETGRERDGKGFVEFETGADLKTAVENLDGKQFKDAVIHCTPDIQDGPPSDKSYRQRSPPRGRYGPPGYDEYGRGPPRGYSPRGHNRERSPRGRPDDYYGRLEYGRRTPPPRGEYGPPPPRRDPYYEADYRNGPPGPPRGYDDGYARNGAPYGGRPRTPPRGGYGSYGGGYPYEERRF